jgi:acrylyl-CoA reductase (NADPH)
MSWRALTVVPESGGVHQHAELVERDDDALHPAASDDRDVIVDVEYSSINYKDGLALTGRPGVIRTPGIAAGIDLVGTVAEVLEPTSPWKPGDRVLVNGWGIGEQFDGGLAERALVASDWLIDVPSAFSSEQAAAIGTAGFTAMLAVLAIEETAAEAGSESTVLVTGASGGVGSIATSLLSTLGYRVAASTGRESEHDYLRGLGASEIVDRSELSGVSKPLGTQRWAAAIDSLGGQSLATVLSHISYGGVVAACGLAHSADLPASVMPFILRAVTLTGINSVYCPRGKRGEAWERLATDLDLAHLEAISETVGLSDAIAVAERIMAGGVRGRTVVDVRN